jgi:hypothetical protein
VSLPIDVTEREESPRMSHSFKLSRRIARFRASLFAVLVVALLGCDESNSFNPDSTSPDPISTIDEDIPFEEDAPLEEDGLIQATPVDGAPLAALSYAGGIPIGLTAQPTGDFGSRYNGALRIIYPQYLMENLSAIRARGGKLVLNMSGGMSRYTDRDGNFSLSQWKEQVDRYRNLNLESYIRDGTLMAHYLIDEPHHASKWNGRPISGTTLEEMARYSKAKWPGLATVVRTYPPYLEKWGPYRYLDAAWAQYVHRFGNVRDFLDEHVSSARRQGLGLVVGLNVLKGGPDKSKMSASQVKEWGSVLLSSSYPCAFISWKYDDRYLSTSSMRDAMSYLRNRAENLSMKSCRGS